MLAPQVLLYALLQAIFKYVRQLPPHKAATKLQRLMQPLLASGTMPTSATELEVAELLNTALDRQCSSSVSASAAAGSEAVDGAASAAAAGDVPPLSEDLLELLGNCAAAAGIKLRDAMRGASLVTLTAGEQWNL